MITNLLGFTAALLTTVAFLPQMVKTWQTKSAKDVSLGMLITFCTGVFMWLVYGIIRQDIPLILANLVTFIFNSIILGLKLKYK